MSAHSSSVSWLVRMPEIFSGMEGDILADLEVVTRKRLGRDYLLVRTSQPRLVQDSAAAKFLRWNLPVQHSWLCRPEQTAGFVEKAAQALWSKFGPQQPQNLLVGALDPDANYFRKLAANLRGRTLQLFPPDAGMRDAEDQHPGRASLFCMVGREGLFCGMHTPRDAHGFHPGGTRFIRQSSPDAISRAGAKLAEALHHLRLYRDPPPGGAHWLELGASPGGMTAELLARGYRVTAVDRAPLDARLDGAKHLQAVRKDAEMFSPPQGTMFDAILCDMNGDSLDSLSLVLRQIRHLHEGGLVVFTLKLAGAEGYGQINHTCDQVLASARAAGLHVLALSHLTYNRQEFTVLLEKRDA